MLYYPTGADDIFAVSAASGKILWEHKGELPETVADVCCGWDNRGVTIGEGKVYSAVLNGSVEALNQQTGELVWKTELGEPAEGFTVTSAPLYYEGMIFIGPVGSEYGVRGFMEAFNAKTGALVWKHYNIPAPGEFGHEILADRDALPRMRQRMGARRRDDVERADGRPQGRRYLLLDRERRRRRDRRRQERR